MNSTVAATINTSPQLEEIKRSLDLLHEPGEVFEVRCLGVPGGRGFTSTASGYFDDSAKAATYIAACDRRKQKGIYTTLNPVLPALLSRAHNRIVDRAKSTTTDGDIIRRHWLPFDIDPHRPSGIAATAAEVDLARSLAGDTEDILRSMGWGYPLYVSSGNGVYMLFRIDLPNTAESLATITRIYAAVNHRLGSIDLSKPYAEIDTTVGNAARILRVGGTVNRKGDETPDRPWRMCTYFDPDPDYPVEVNR